MSTFWNFAFGFVLIILWIIVGGFCTEANVKLDSSKGMDDDLKKAYTNTLIIAIITWVLVGLFIILVILSVLGVIALFGSGVGEEGLAAEGSLEAEQAESNAFKAEERKAAGHNPGGKKAKSEGISWLTLGFLLFALILVIIDGVLSAQAASSISSSKHFDKKNSDMNKAYNDCIISACLCLGTVGLLIIGLIAYYVAGRRRKKRIEEIKEQDIKEIQALHQLKQQSLQQQIAQQKLLQTQQLQRQQYQQFQPQYQPQYQQFQPQYQPQYQQQFQQLQPQPNPLLT